MLNIKKSTLKITYMGFMLAIIMVLSIVEHSLPPAPMLPPNFKLGLSNIVIMYSLFFMGKKEAFLLLFLKSAFTLLRRGPVAGILSLSGGLLSVAVIMIILYISKQKASYTILSVFGAIFHNIGQLIAAGFLLKSVVFLYSIPLILVFGTAMGLITGFLLKLVMPYFDHLLKE